MTPLNKTLEYLHQMRGSLLPVEAVAYSHRRGHVLTVDASALRLWSLRKELSFIPRAPRSAPPVSLLRLADSRLPVNAESVAGMYNGMI